MEQPVLQHKEKLISDKTLYHKYKLWVIEKEIRLRLSQDTLEVKTYNENGEKVLIQQYENNKVTYRREYKRRKKHGKEFCYDDDGNELVFEYINGKKVKE